MNVRKILFTQAHDLKNVIQDICDTHFIYYLFIRFCGLEKNSIKLKHLFKK